MNKMYSKRKRRIDFKNQGNYSFTAYENQFIKKNEICLANTTKKREVHFYPFYCDESFLNHLLSQ